MKETGSLRAWVIALSLGLAVSAFALRLVSSAEPNAGPAVNIEFCGRVSFWDTVGKTTVEAVFAYSVDARTSQGELVIRPLGDSKAFPVFRLSPEIGQQLPVSFYPVSFEESGEMLVANWGWGATATKLTVFHLGADGKVEVVFDEISRFGFQILDVADEGIPNIVGCYGDPGAEKKQMKAFSWNGQRFKHTASAEVAKPHLYQIVR